jgi:hypothetical protein
MGLTSVRRRFIKAARTHHGRDLVERCVLPERSWGRMSEFKPV